MRNAFLVFFFIISGNLFAQIIERSLVIKDADTQQPIEDATVYVVKTKQTLLSNTNGVVTFILNGGSNIQISHTSYVAMTVKSVTLKDRETIIYLKSNINNLDEVIITKKHPQKILKALIENSSQKLTVPARLKVYSREFFKLNGAYSYYNDGLINFQISGKSTNFRTNILVEQNRSYGLIDKEVSADLLGYNLNDIMENYYNFKYLNPLLESSARKEFEFLIKAYATNSNYYMMTVSPMDNSKTLLDNFTIVYDNKEKIIIEVSAYLSPATLARVEEKTAVGTKNIYKSFYKTIYRNDGTNYYLMSSKEEIGFQKNEKKKSNTIEVRNYFITTNFSEQNYSFKEGEEFKDKTLFNKNNVILSDYWSTSGLTTTPEEQDIIDTLEEKE